MAFVSYNTSYLGVLQDDYIVGENRGIIDAENITGLKTGYGWTLGPKVNNHMSVLDKPSSILLNDFGNFTRSYIGDISGNIYRMDQSDDTPSYTLTTSNYGEIINLYFWGSPEYLLIFHKYVGASDFYIGRIRTAFTQAITPDWSSIDESWFINGVCVDNIAINNNGTFLYIGTSRGTIKRYDSGFTEETFGLFSDYIVGITVQGTMLKVYCRDGGVYLWNGTSNNFSSYHRAGFRIQSAIQNGTIDYITTEDGDIYISSGLDIQRLHKFRTSDRLNVNTSFGNVGNFSKEFFIGGQLEMAKGNPFIISNNDINKTIYEYGSVFDSLPKGFHKIVNQNYLYQEPDEFNDIGYYNGTDKRIYFGWSKDTEYGVDYFDIFSDTSTKDGYFITDVFRGPVDTKNKIEAIYYTVSNTYGTSGDNYIKIYRRINNGDWVIMRDINYDDNTIRRDKITTQNSQFIDIQFKVEFHNDDEGEIKPILHSFTLEYGPVENG